MNTLRDRLAEERAAQSLTQEDLANAVGVKKQTISAIERGITLTPSHAVVTGIAKRLGVTEEWLLTGRGAKAHERGAPRVGEATGAVYVSSGDIAAGYVRLPLLAMEGAMGAGAFSDAELEVVQHLDVANWWAAQHLPHALDRVKIISSRGDSMAGLINHGDIVFVDVGINFYEGEGIYVFNWQGRALIKRLIPNIRTGKLQIVSTNSAAYPPEDISLEEIDELHIAGRVVAWFTLRKH